MTGPGYLVEIDFVQRELTHEEGVEIRRAIARDFEAHGGAISAMRELAFERAAQVVDFFVVDEQVAVARDAELIAAEHFHAGEELRDELLHDAGEQHEALAAVVFGQRDDARQRARRLHDGESGVAAERILAGEAHDEVQALVLDARKGTRGIEAERREHRLDLALEILFEPLRGGGVPGGARQQLDALMPQCRQQHVVEAGVLRIDQARACGRGSPAAAR